MRKILVISLVIIVFALGGLYTYFSGKEYVYRFSEQQLQEKLNSKLPFSRRYLLIFEVTLDKPRISLVDGSDRIAAGLDIILNIHVSNSATPLGGTVDVSGKLAYDSGKGEFFLTDPVIEKLEVQGIPEKYTKKASIVIAQALGDFYKANPVYRLSGTDMKQAAARLALKDVVIKEQVLIVTLGI